METVEYVSGHRMQIIKYAAAAILVIVLAGGTWIYREGKHTERMNALNDAFKVYNSQVVAQGNPPPFANYWFRTPAEKSAAVNKAFVGLADKYPNSDEGMIAHYYLGVIAGDDGKTPEAEKQFKYVVDNASNDYASLAKLSLAELYKADGKVDEGSKLIQSIINKPTTFVSKDEATIALARLIEQTKPDEARKLLEPLRTSMHSGVSQAAIGALGDMIQQQSQPK
ncbi:MAG TPA: tetratricopeptide repeat protein [Bryobacteraceae bacterium]